jgi:hypothetical protein
MFHMAREVHKMFKDQVVDPGDFLHKILLECSRFCALPPDMVWRMLFFRSGGELSHEPSGKREERKRKHPRDRSRLAKAWGKKRQSPDSYQRARNGDHTIIPFECDMCIFHKL